MIKVVGLLTRKPGMSHEAFVRHWSDIHGPLAHAVPGIRRYVQSHIVDTRTRPDIPETEVEIDGIAELWYDDLESLRRAAATPEDLDRIRDIIWQHPGSRRVKLRVTGGEKEPVWILPSQEFRINAEAEAALEPWIAGR